jgi:hypothetical protein
MPLHGTARNRFGIFMGVGPLEGQIRLTVRDDETRQVLLEVTGTPDQISDEFGWWLTKHE